jgi:hypothetical protein
MCQSYSNSEQDMKYPQREQTILQWFDSRRFPQTGQNWLGNSRAAVCSPFLDSASPTKTLQAEIVLTEIMLNSSWLRQE